MRGSREAIAIFRDVQSRAIATILLMLGGGVALSVAPFELGTIRLAGVSLLWWYGVVATPVVAVAVAAAALARGRRAPDPAE
jgi:hypothetical protein